MSIWAQAWEFLTTGSNWLGENGLTRPTFGGGWRFAQDSILALLIEHLWMSVAAVALAAGVGLPLGATLGHWRKGAAVTVAAANLSRAIPTLALLTLFAASAIGFGNRAVIIAGAIFALPPILAHAFTGVAGVDRDVTDAARGLGMSGWHVTWRVEAPLALAVIAAGLRTAVTQTVATVPLAALVAGGGLGVIINTGLATQRYGQVLAGGLLVAALTIGIDAGLATAQRALTPVRREHLAARTS